MSYPVARARVRSGEERAIDLRLVRRADDLLRSAGHPELVEGPRTWSTGHGVGAASSVGRSDSGHADRPAGSYDDLRALVPDVAARILEEGGAYFRAAATHVDRVAKGPRRRVWRLHAEGWSVTRIYRDVRSARLSSRRQVYEVIAEERDRMVARMQRGPLGRPSRQGLGTGSRVIALRLQDGEAEALAMIAERLGVSEGQALRACLRAQVEHFCKQN